MDLIWRWQPQVWKHKTSVNRKHIYKREQQKKWRDVTVVLEPQTRKLLVYYRYSLKVFSLLFYSPFCYFTTKNMNEQINIKLNKSYDLWSHTIPAALGTSPQTPQDLQERFWNSWLIKKRIIKLDMIWSIVITAFIMTFGSKWRLDPYVAFDPP